MTMAARDWLDGPTVAPRPRRSRLARTNGSDGQWTDRPLAASRRPAGRRLEWRRAPLRVLPAITASSEGYQSLSDLVDRGYIGVPVAVRGMMLIKYLFKQGTVDAAISPEEGGLIFYWAAAEMSITIEVVARGGFWWSVQDVTGQNYSGEGAALPVAELAHSLTQFSKEVDRRNPCWRAAIR